ncbi:MAG: 50S ribosomal protein L37ae [Candidatus Lokiarchaeota archaeon]|nr:50S ribosomal protein L37ae [Candidatus Lokiarchaeota archaeon]
MAKTKKMGITGRYGTRYGSRIRKRVRQVEESMKAPTKCPVCETKVSKRISTGIWYCKKCGAKYTGGSYTQMTQPGLESQRIATRVQRELEEKSKE